MLSARSWLLYVLLPLALVIVFDQVTKQLGAAAYAVPVDYGWLRLGLLRNPGFMLGSLGELPKLYTVVVPATFGAVLLFVFAVLQYFLPFQSLALRAGGSILVGGVLSNLIDRVHSGSVIDFIMLRTPLGATGVFNVADALQWVGVAVFFSAYLVSGRLFFPLSQRRGRKWIDPSFQLRYCLVLIAVGLGFALIGGILSYTFLRYSVVEITSLGEDAVRRFVSTFVTMYAFVATGFAVILFFVGVYLSHRIVGPIKGFENFLEQLLKGGDRQLKLRRTDELKQLETMADRFYQLFHERLGVTPPALAQGDQAPYFEAQTADRATYGQKDLEGKKVWMIFYRFATCPLCATHIADIKATIKRAQDAGVVVIAVYESEPEEFEKPGFEVTTTLLKSLAIPLIADPQRKLYRAYRTHVNPWAAIFHPKVWMPFLKSKNRVFRVGAVEGELGQLPAHFLIDQQGVIVHAYYGKHAADHLELSRVDAFVAS
jgi:signal peptidase II